MEKIITETLIAWDQGGIEMGAKQAISLHHRLGVKFSLFTILLLGISGAGSFFLSNYSLNSVVHLSATSSQELNAEVDMLNEAALLQLKKQRGLEVKTVRLQGELNQLKKELDISRKLENLRGRLNSALLIIGSQLESVLQGMSPDDREMYLLDASTYQSLLKGVRSIDYRPIIDEASLESHVGDAELGPDHARALKATLAKGATAANPNFRVLSKQKKIRVSAMVGPKSGYYGILDVVLDDTLSPLENELKKLQTSSMVNIFKQTKSMNDRMNAVKAAMARNIEATKQKSAQRDQEALEATGNSRSLLIAVAVLTTLFSAMIIALLMRTLISCPLTRAVKVMNRLASGDLSVEVPDMDSRSEIGEMARAVGVFKENALHNRQLEDAQAHRARKQEEAQKQLMHALADGFDASVGEIVQTVSATASELQSTARTMTEISDDTSNQANAVAAASEQASSNVEQAAASTDQMSGSIGEIGEQVMNASRASRRAVDDVEKTSREMEVLAETANKIGDVIKIISDIADQTNLLALNATIESARAGEAGKGFAVVANEVKGLASQTGKATDEIVQQIKEIQMATEQAVNSMTEIGTSIHAVDDTSSVISQAMEEQGSATQEIAVNVREAAAGTREVTQNITVITDAAAKAGQASTQVLGAADQLANQSNALRQEVESFLDKLRQGWTEDEPETEQEPEPEQDAGPDADAAPEAEEDRDAA
ncbi:MAG: hypothetical protein C0605_00640 [Hyphomicrobiales bacterium]|nr:MAG: hypothetical protein C0605_00640 [Hyphomicrobiales bacterium]